MRYRASQVVLVVKILPANAGEVRETWVSSLGQEDPLEDGITIHSSILVWGMPWTEKPGRLLSMAFPKQEFYEPRSLAGYNPWGRT